ncbi:MAG: hypothetical protein RJA29_2231, partial [Pseudomonadota bacterium]
MTSANTKHCFNEVFILQVLWAASEYNFALI